jgi:hypothetical protein
MQTSSHHFSSGRRDDYWHWHLALRTVSSSSHTVCSPVSVVSNLLARSQSTFSAKVTGISTLPTSRSSKPVALGWGESVPKRILVTCLIGILTGIPATAFTAS